ncbi:MAG TPA: MFS transporter, partial [Puia sp.]|nr:MFS transporter [Puia sp.]
GTLIEWYDFYIFGSLATIISTHFFPRENPTASFLATLATFAAGLVVRPFGSLFFGRLGDMIGRKYTFMITMVIMGGSTFAIGLIPSYDTIGFWAPVIILILRLLQGLAIGGEYGGAATFVAEHAPVNRRGFWTSWIQTTVIFAFITSIVVIIATKMVMDKSSWESWGWRIPFLASILLLFISVWIRRNMRESPLFLKAKTEGRISVNPIKESFGNKTNMKVVLLALFGLTMGVAAGGWATVLYAQTFLIKTMQLDFDQANRIVMIGIFLASLFTIFFGWLSDRIGRKPLLMFSLLLAVLLIRPIYGEMYRTIDLNSKVEDFGKTIQSKRESVSISNSDSLFTFTTLRYYTDGTIREGIQKDVIRNQKKEKTEITSATIVNHSDFKKLVVLVFLLSLINSVAYGPLAAFLVEMFPLKIRYTSLSLPYHIGYGIFGGMSQVISTYLISRAFDTHRTDFYLAGLSYPIVIMSISLVIGVLYIKENRRSFFNPSIEFFNLNKLRRWLGILWIFLGLAAAYFGIFQLGIPKITSGKQEDLIFGIIVMLIITPIASVGLIIFGKYALEGEYTS